MNIRIFRILIPVCLAASRCLSAEPARPYSDFGELIVTQFQSAPFPHPQRAGGHTYKDQQFSAAEHYSDSTVALFIPKNCRPDKSVGLLVHFHGWRNNVTNVLREYRLIEQLAESGKNAVLVVPQGPRDAPDSFGGKLEDAGGFQRFVAEVLSTLRRQSSLKGKNLAAGKIILSGHSGGYRVMAWILHQGGLTQNVREVWLFDALYAETEKFLAWADRTHGRLVNIYTDHGGTNSETEQMITSLKARGTAVFAGEEPEAAPMQLQTNHFVFLHTALEHNDVVAGHESFAQFLKTSCFEAAR